MVYLSCQACGDLSPFIENSTVLTTYSEVFTNLENPDKCLPKHTVIGKLLVSRESSSFPRTCLSVIPKGCRNSTAVILGVKCKSALCSTLYHKRKKFVHIGEKSPSILHYPAHHKH